MENSTNTMEIAAPLPVASMPLSSSSSSSSAPSQYQSSYPSHLQFSSSSPPAFSDLAPLLSRPLYGGALSITLPARFDDCSKYREIPSHQEVWADGGSDQSVIIEINSRQDDIADAEIASYCFNDLSEHNEAKNSMIIAMGQVDKNIVPITADSSAAPGASVWYCIGFQEVSKYHDASTASNIISLHLLVIRLPHIDTDLLISFNAPIMINKQSSVMKTGEGISERPWKEHGDIMYVMTRTIIINDWGLFKQDDAQGMEENGLDD